MEFSILIGSHARGDADSLSDCDLLLINVDEATFDYSRLPIADRSLVNIVNYEFDMFLDLYEMGSLFIYHAFMEGVLLSGNAEHWNSLKKNFNVQRNFHSELLEIKRVTDLLAKTDIFGGKYLTPLVNAFTELKNACIFSLAHNGVYEFNKSKCFDLAIGPIDSHFQLKELKAFYDFSIRGLDVILPFGLDNKEISIFLLKRVNLIVRECAMPVSSKMFQQLTSLFKSYEDASDQVEFIKNNRKIIKVLVDSLWEQIIFNLFSVQARNYTDARAILNKNIAGLVLETDIAVAGNLTDVLKEYEALIEKAT